MENKNKKEIKSNKKAFTVFELLVVLTVLAVIMVIVVVSINNISDDAQAAGNTVSRESVLTAAENYTYEYLINSSVWTAETDDDGNEYEMYCINSEILKHQGFLPIDMSNYYAVKIKKDFNEKISTQIVQDISECDSSIPIINIVKTDNSVFPNNYTVDEILNFKITLDPALEGGRVSYREFSYSIYDVSDTGFSNPLHTVNCDDGSRKLRECMATIDNDELDGKFYGKYVVKAYVGKSSTNYAEITKTFTINKKVPIIQLSGDAKNQKEIANFTLKLSNVDTYKKFYYSILDKDNNVIEDFKEINCDKNPNETEKECSVTINNEIHDGKYYEDHKIVAYVEKNSQNNKTNEFPIYVVKQTPAIKINLNTARSYDEYADFTLSLTNVHNNQYKEFYYTVYDNKNKVVPGYDKYKCNSTECSLVLNKDTTDNYGTFKIEATAIKNSHNNTMKSDTFTIVNLNDTITISPNEPDGNNGYFTGNNGSTISVTSKIGSNTTQENKYTRTNFCISGNNITSTSDSSWNNCKLSSSLSMTESNSGKYACARYQVKRRTSKYIIKCQQYKIDTTLPSLTLSNNGSSGYSLKLKGTVSGSYNDGVKYKIANYSDSSSYVCDGSGFSSITSSNIYQSHNSGKGDKSIWFKDNAGNCRKVASYGYSVNENLSSTTNSSSKQGTISTPNTVSAILYNYENNNKAIFSAKTITFTYTPIFDRTDPYGSGPHYKTVTESAKKASHAPYVSNACLEYSCTKGGKVSGSQCVSNITFNTNSSNHLISVDRQNCTCSWSAFECKSVGYKYKNQWNGQCPTGYTKKFYDSNVFHSISFPKSTSSYSNFTSVSGRTSGHAQGRSCVVSDTMLSGGIDYYIYFPYSCNWNGNYSATCVERDDTPYCEDYEELVNDTACYYCAESNDSDRTLLSSKPEDRECEYSEKYYNSVTYYKYGNHAILYTLK